MTDLGAWLREQIDEDERAAQAAAGGGRWRYEDGDSVGAWTLYDEHWNIASLTTYDTESYNYAERLPAFRPPTYIDPDAIGRHIARHDPARVLADVAAKRAIIADCTEMLKMCQVDRGGNLGRPGEHMMGDFGRWILQKMAAPYATHPDYDPAWQPAEVIT